MNANTKRSLERAKFARMIRQLDDRDERDELDLDDSVIGQRRPTTPITTLHRFDSIRTRMVTHAD